MPGKSKTPELQKHCVADVAPKFGGDTHRAFAICTASLQKAGEMKKGHKDLTKKGAARSASKVDEPGASQKRSDFETLLKANRKSEGISLSDSIDTLKLLIRAH